MGGNISQWTKKKNILRRLATNIRNFFSGFISFFTIVQSVGAGVMETENVLVVAIRLEEWKKPGTNNGK